MLGVFASYWDAPRRAWRVRLADVLDDTKSTTIGGSSDWRTVNHSPIPLITTIRDGNIIICNPIDSRPMMTIDLPQTRESVLFGVVYVDYNGSAIVSSPSGYHLIRNGRHISHRGPYDGFCHLARYCTDNITGEIVVCKYTQETYNKFRYYISKDDVSLGCVTLAQNEIPIMSAGNMIAFGLRDKVVIYDPRTSMLSPQCEGDVYVSGRCAAVCSRGLNEYLFAICYRSPSSYLDERTDSVMHIHDLRMIGSTPYKLAYNGLANSASDRVIVAA